MHLGWIGVVLGVVAFGPSDADAQGKKAPKQLPPAPQPEPAPPPPPPAEENAWSKGVTAEQKAIAQTSLEAGNDHFVKNEYREALAEYERAVAAWDHPAIRFNMVRALIALERPLDATTSLERALRFGKGPFEDQLYTEALNYQRLLAGQVAEYEIRCAQKGVQIKVDGEAVLTCPGTSSKRVLPGTHVVVGSLAGFQTQTQDVVLLGGKKQPITVELLSLDKATVYKTRWPTWQPWAVAGGGLALAGVGLLVTMQARSNLDQIESDLGGQCPSGCTPEEYDATFGDRESSALMYDKIGISMMVVGGAVTTAGIVGVIINRPKAYVAEQRSPVARVVPTLNGIGVVGRF